MTRKLFSVRIKTRHVADFLETSLSIVNSIWTDTWHDDLDDALAQLDWEYEDLSKNLVWYVEPS